MHRRPPGLLRPEARASHAFYKGDTVPPIRKTGTSPAYCQAGLAPAATMAEDRPVQAREEEKPAGLIRHLLLLHYGCGKHPKSSTT